MEQKYVINIARQFGSLGRPIAKRLSEILGIEYYDRDIVEKAAKIMNLPVSVISNAEERHKKSNFFNMLFPLGTESHDMQEKIFNVQRDIILNISEKESCIIVGRCSDYILDTNTNRINIFIYAPYEDRYKNCIEALHMTPEEARKMIHEVDKARNAYHMKYAKYLPGDLNHTDLILNSSLLGVEGTAQFLAETIRIKYPS